MASTDIEAATIVEATTRASRMLEATQRKQPELAARVIGVRITHAAAEKENAA